MGPQGLPDADGNYLKSASLDSLAQTAGKAAADSSSFRGGAAAATPTVRVDRRRSTVDRVRFNVGSKVNRRQSALPETTEEEQDDHEESGALAAVALYGGAGSTDHTAVVECGSSAADARTTGSPSSPTTDEM